MSETSNATHSVKDRPINFIIPTLQKININILLERNHKLYTAVHLLATYLSISSFLELVCLLTHKKVQLYLFISHLTLLAEGEIQ
jgi:hypothetical protein